MSKNENQSAAITPPTTQAAFVEACVREGWRIADVQMWQNLCKKLAVLSDDSDLSVMLLLSIADDHGISPVQLCAYARDEGYKALDKDAVEHLAEMLFAREASGDEDDNIRQTQAVVDEGEADHGQEETDVDEDEANDAGVPPGSSTSDGVVYRKKNQRAVFQPSLNN